jgi:hypothetical protein
LEAGPHEKPRPGKQRVLDTGQSQRIIAMVCGTPPEGQAHWSVRLIAREAMKRRLTSQVGRETIRILLQSHDLKPWREKMWCLADLNEESIARMEDVLNIYEKPLQSVNPWFALMRSRLFCMPNCVRRGPSAQGESCGATRSTSVAAPPTSSAGLSLRRGFISPR